MNAIARANAIADFDRRFRAVMAADVVGYSRLMEAAELDTHSRCRALQVSLIDPTIVAHRGEVAKNTGDGFIALFESPVDAVLCARTLQEEIAQGEARHSPERRIVFRIGLHWEDVIIERHDVFGAGVNIACRLQTFAPAGGVVLSSAILAQISGRLETAVDPLGALHLRNISKPVEAFALVMAGIDRHEPAQPSSEHRQIPSLAVLPFGNLSANANDAYFADGFTEDIIVNLGSVQDILVVSRGSTTIFRQLPLDAGKVSQRLGVRYLVRGSIQRAGARLRIFVELTDIATNSILWTENYDVNLDRIFELQDEIAINVVGKVASYVRKAEVRRSFRKPPHSLDAFDCLLQALDLLYRLDFASFSRAGELLARAVEKDEDYAAAYAYSAKWRVFRIGEGWSPDLQADAAEALRLSACAIEREPLNALALAVHGHVQGMCFRRYDTAIDFLDRAVAASPNNSWAWAFGSGTYGFIGDARAGIERAERAIRLSPVDQQAFFHLCLLGQNHYLDGSYEDAALWSRKAMNLNPRFGNAVRVMAASLVALGRTEEAQEVGAHHAQILPGFRVSDYALRCPFVDPYASRYLADLRAAGIPD